MSIEDLTLREIRELQSLLSPGAESDHPFCVGKSYFIRTVTMHLVGKLESVGSQELVLSSASWVADSGRFHDALAAGTLNEVEPFVGDVIVGRSAIIDATQWSHKLPSEQK